MPLLLLQSPFISCRNQPHLHLDILCKLSILIIFHTVDPAPYIDGVRINSPHYLCKMVLKEAGTHKFTLVVSQYEKHLTIHYSLRVYSTCPFSLHKIKNLCKHKNEARSYTVVPSIIKFYLLSLMNEIFLSWSFMLYRLQDFYGNSNFLFTWI